MIFIRLSKRVDGRKEGREGEWKEGREGEMKEGGRKELVK
jgi:hypothetical protein